MNDSSDELVDVVDDDDRVIATVSRAEMRARRLRHRAVSIVVIGHDGRLLIHRRADTKDIWPGMWDIAAGGVVAAGESYELAAVRELAEELGVVGAVLEPLGDGRFDDESVMLTSRCFRTVDDGPFHFVDDEITEVQWVTLAELSVLLDERCFVPDSIAVLLPLLMQRSD